MHKPILPPNALEKEPFCAIVEEAGIVPGDGAIVPEDKTYAAWFGCRHPTTQTG
jgi:hypothetical protein